MRWPQKGEQACGILALLTSYPHRPTKGNTETYCLGPELELGGTWTLLYVWHHCKAVLPKPCQHPNKRIC